MNQTERKEKRKKGRMDGFCCSFLHVLRSGSSTGKGQMLLLCLPENKGGEDYAWISSLFMARSNPLPSLVWLSSGRSLRLRTVEMQLLAVGLVGSTCQVGTCLDNSGPASGHPPRIDVTSWTCFLLLLSHPLTAGETEAQGDSVCAS